MLLTLLYLFPTFIVVTSNFNFAENYKLITDYYVCDKNCYFAQPEITLKSIDKWPSECKKVCGIFILTENSDVPIAKLRDALSKMTKLLGGIRIDNSIYKNLNFLPKFQIECDAIGTTIINNSDLDNIDFLLNITKMDSCAYRITGNSALDSRNLCDSRYEDVTRSWMVFRNKYDCACPGAKLTWRNAETQFADCENITGKITITDLNGTIPNFSKLKRLHGNLEIVDTQLQNLSFLAGLESFYASSAQSTYDEVLSLHGNSELRSLGLKGLKNFGNNNSGHAYINFESSVKEFCLTVQEVSVFLDGSAPFGDFWGRYCPDWSWSIDWPKLCVFDKMANLDVGCVYIFGNLLVESGDEEYVRKLVDVRRVFGTITIRNTSLENAHFLRKLEIVANLNSRLPLMQFLQNRNLQNLQFPNAQTFRDVSFRRIIVDGNHPDVFLKTRYCIALQHRTGANVSYNGEGCKSVNKSLPGGLGFDFDKDTDYMDFSDYEVWYDEYDGDFYYINTTLFDATFTILNHVNTITAAIGFSINIVNLIVLFQPELRTSFIFILMIGISICEIQLVATFLFEFLLDANWIYQKDTCNDKAYFDIVFSLLKDPLQSMARRCSSFLAVLMAVFRTLSVMFPLNSVIRDLSKPKSAVLMVVGMILICFVWDFALVVRCEIYSPASQKCQKATVPYEFYNYNCPKDDEYDDFSIPIYKIISLLDGFSTVITAILYSIFTILLAIQLRIVQKRRRSVKEAEKSFENTLMLVTVMSMSFFISEMLYGASYIFEQLIFAYFDRLKQLSESARIVVWTCLIINSSVHCLICFFMSTQYRSVARRVFWRNEKISSVNMASISATKSSKG